MKECKHDWEYKREEERAVIVKKRSCRLCSRVEMFMKNPKGKFYDDGVWVEVKR